MTNKGDNTFISVLATRPSFAKWIYGLKKLHEYITDVITIVLFILSKGKQLNSAIQFGYQKANSHIITKPKPVFICLLVLFYYLEQYLSRL